MSNQYIVQAGDCRTIIHGIPDNSIDSIVTDPPYALVSVVKRFGKAGSAPAQYGTDGAFARASKGFMGKTWDTGEVAHDPEFWAECLRVLKPGGFILAFGGTRTYHRLAVAIEDAGFEIRDMIQWLYGSGFPKSHDVSKGIDKAAGVEREVVGNTSETSGRTVGLGTSEGYHGDIVSGHCRDITAPATDAAKQWSGWGTALKPANEPICMARKPLSEKTVAANVLRWGTGAINIDGCRVDVAANDDIHAKNPHTINKGSNEIYGAFSKDGSCPPYNPAAGRWPANVITDGSDEVVAGFPSPHGAGSARVEPGGGSYTGETGIGFAKDGKGIGAGFKGFRIGDSGSAARFFYSAKASKKERAGSNHPTVKPIALLRYLCRLITPPGGKILDPFAGSGTTGEAAILEGFRPIMIEQENEYVDDIMRRMNGLEMETYDRVLQRQ